MKVNEKQQASSADGYTRDFTYAEPERISPTWQILRDVSETIVLTLLMFLVIRLVVQDFQVDGTSMLPTLQNNQFVLVDKLTYLFGSPQRGDIIVFQPPTSSKDPYIKRVIGVPGDTVLVTSAGTVLVNGVALTEPYVNDLDNPYGQEQVTLGPNQYFVLGDNRGASSDSRDWGTVKRSVIIGKASLVYWPISNFHTLPHSHQVFAHTPSGIVPGMPTGTAAPQSASLPATLEILFLAPGLTASAIAFRRRPLEVP